MANHKRTYSISSLLVVWLVLVGCGRTTLLNTKSIPEDTRIKIVTSGEGFFEIDENELVASGVPKESIENHSIWLYQRGKEIPFWLDVSGGKTKIRFFAPASTSRYSVEYVTILTNQKQDNEEHAVISDWNINGNDGFLKANDNQYIVSERFEENHIYQPKSKITDPWLWLNLSAPNIKEIRFTVTDILDSPGKIKLMVWASTEADSNPDHQIILSINNQKVGESSWDGKGSHLLEVDFKSGVLQNGENLLTITAPGIENVDAEIIWIDWFELSYLKYSTHFNGSIKYTSQGQLIVLPDDSGPIEIYLFEHNTIRRLDNYDEPLQTWVGEKNKNYWLVGSKGYRKPDSIEEIRIDKILQKTTGADYVVISSETFFRNLEPLLEHRRFQGLKTLLVSSSSIDNQFNNGFHEPDSIRNYLKWALENWEISPRYVVLVGDNDYDYRGFMATRSKNDIPSFFVNTLFGGETVSDIGYAELSGNTWSNYEGEKGDRKLDIAVGRIPASNKNQLNVYVEKIINYEEGLFESLNEGEVLIIADASDSGFQMNAERFSKILSNKMKVDVHLLPGELDDGLLDMNESWIKNKELLVYFGHGSITQWGKSGILTVDQIQNIPEMEKIPVVLEMTCLSGYFSHPKVQSISEVMLFQPDKGAIALVAPTSLTLLDEQTIFSDSFSEQYISEQHTRIGDVYLSAWNQAASGGKSIDDLLNTYLLLGDPALLLRK